MSIEEKKRLVELGNQMDPNFEKAWNCLISATEEVGWKDVYYLVLKFQKELATNYRFFEQSKTSPSQ